jgi:hypothetical protein
MLPERGMNFAGKKALDGAGVKHFASSAWADPALGPYPEAGKPESVS